MPTTSVILTLNKVRYKLGVLRAVAATGPLIDITRSAADLSPENFTLHYSINRETDDVSEDATKSALNHENVIAYQWHGKYVFLQGQETAKDAIESSKAVVSARLISKPMLKRALLDIREVNIAPSANFVPPMYTPRRVERR